MDDTIKSPAKMIAKLLLLAPALTFISLILNIHRFKSVNQCMWTVALGMLLAFVLMFVGIYLSLNP